MGRPIRTRPPRFDLAKFVPYRLTVLAEEVSQTIAQVYVDRFELSRHEWRVLAWLGNHRTMQAKEIGRNAGLDKMQMSRALAGLQARKLVAIERDKRDRRGNILRLTRQGRVVYGKIAPLALAREDYLLSALTSEEAAALDTIVAKLLTRATELKSRG